MKSILSFNHDMLIWAKECQNMLSQENILKLVKLYSIYWTDHDTAHIVWYFTILNISCIRSRGDDGLHARAPSFSCSRFGRYIKFQEETNMNDQVIFF
jgi:hypothetical protein